MNPDRQMGGAGLSALGVPRLKAVIYQESEPALGNAPLNLPARVRD